MHSPEAADATSLTPVLFLGDSHTQYFSWAIRHHLFAPRQVQGKEVGGATAVGMRNPNSLTDAIGIFRAFMADKNRDAIVVTHMGEVDCGYVIWYRAGKYGDSTTHQLEESIAAYFEFVDELRGQGFHRFVITGATLPTINDTDQIGDVIEKRKGISATMRERTDLTFQYNARLRAEALQRGLIYTDVTEDVLDPATGFVHQLFRNPSAANHHMKYWLAASVWARRLNECFTHFDPPSTPDERSWVADTNSFLKGSAVHRNMLPDHMFVRVEAGDVLRARFDSESDQYIVISQATLNGQALAPWIRLAQRAHWKSA